MANIAFDASTVDPQNTYDPLPAGEYLCMVIDSDVKPTKNGNGHYAQMTLQVIDGEFNQRLLWDRINIQNQNQIAQEIGQKQLSALCHAVGVLQVQDTEQLHNIPVVVKLGVKSDPQYGPQNEVKGYKAATEGSKPVSAPQAAAPVQQAAASGAAVATPPWQR